MSREEVAGDVLAEDEGTAPVRVPHHAQETDFTCGPAAVRMVIDALWGIRVEEASLAERMGTDAHVGTRQRVLAKFLGALGLEAVVRHTDTDVGEIAALMRDRHIVIVCYWLADEESDHYAVVSHIGPDHIIVQDPWVGPDTRIPLQVFEQEWRGDDSVPTRRDRWLLAVRAP